MPFDLGENIHKWMKVSLVILLVVQIIGNEKSFTHCRILICSDSLCRQAIQEIEWTPA
jgi:hypothetical protein